MPAYKREKTKYKDIFFIQTKTGKKFYIRYYHPAAGKRIEEPVGFSPAMTAARASKIRQRRVFGDASNKERREARKSDEEKETARWTVNRIWHVYPDGKSHYRARYNEENLYDNRVRSNFGDKEPSLIAPLDVDRVRVRLLKEGKKTTAKYALELLRRVVGFGVKKGLCEGLTFHMDIPQFNNERTEYLSAEEIAKLMEAAGKDSDRQIKDIILTALYTGLRKSAILRLRWDDIDFERGLIRLREPKGGKEGEVDTIPLNDKFRKVLESLKRGDSPYVFPGRLGRRRDISESWYRVLARAGLDGFRFHGLRHTFASHLASSGKVETLWMFMNAPLPLLCGLFSILARRRSRHRFELGTDSFESPFSHHCRFVGILIPFLTVHNIV